MSEIPILVRLFRCLPLTALLESERASVHSVPPPTTGRKKACITSLQRSPARLTQSAQTASRPRS
jgi:hypothetical protein